MNAGADHPIEENKADIPSPSAEKKAPSDPSPVDTEQEEEKQEELKLDGHDEPEYPPNSINEAKAKYMRNKHRDAHKYEGGSPRSNKTKKSMMNQVTQMVDGMAQQLLPQINEAGDKLIHAADDAVKSLSSSTGIAFAPIDIPLKRRRQTFAVLIWSLMYVIALALNFIAFRYWTGWKF